MKRRTTRNSSLAVPTVAALAWLCLLSGVALAVGGCGSQAAPMPDAPAPPVARDAPVPAVDIAPSEPAAPLEPEQPDDREGIITVSSVDRLLSAIGSNRTIELEPGIYDLGKAAKTSSGPVSWANVFDGDELVVSQVENLTIRAASDERPKILARPRYAWVIRFVDVADVTLERLILGHTDAGSCTGGVIGLERAKSVRISDSELFGSGTIGLGLESVNGFRFERSVVRGCTYGIAELSGASDVLFVDSQFVDNREFDLVTLQSSPSVHFNRCSFRGNWQDKGYGYAFFKTDADSSLIVEDSKFDSNTFDRLTNEPKRMKVVKPGGGAGAGWASKQLAAPDPQYNQSYAVTRYRNWIVSGSQAGIVFWNRSTGKVDKLIAAFISSDLVVRGKHLWAATYRKIMRFDGLQMKTYKQSNNTRGGRLVIGPGGKLLVQFDGGWFEYQPSQDLLAPLMVTSANHVPAGLGGSSYSIFNDAIVRRNGEVWGIDFLNSLVRTAAGKTTVIPLGGSVYPGTDPRSFYEDPYRKLWVIDFNNGFFRYDQAKGRFAREPGIADKGSAMVVDARRKRTWLLHYTDGVYLKQGKATTFIDLRRLQYMRALHLDKDGSLWVGGWSGLVRIAGSGRSGPFTQTEYVVDSASLGPNARP